MKERKKGGPDGKESGMGIEEVEEEEEELRGRINTKFMKVNKISRKESRVVAGARRGSRKGKEREVNEHPKRGGRTTDTHTHMCAHAKIPLTTYS